MPDHRAAELFALADAGRFEEVLNVIEILPSRMRFSAKTRAGGELIQSRIGFRNDRVQIVVGMQRVLFGCHRVDAPGGFKAVQ